MYQYFTIAYVKMLTLIIYTHIFKVNVKNQIISALKTLLVHTDVFKK